ncbi:response regulator transcription factor [Clostridium sporogenes]|uniref:Stage 0 sporulation protein A homolog n=2 Tax=Clostridium TaxID=1485 RepID=A0A0D1AJV9_CLOBO|nr:MULTISPECIES: response regulator transcription factor [Clostridium]EKS4342213.1 response regulator transcription factor [Clostridium botulinum]MBE6076422.1 response regulator transcription factor [Clostridium lundense]EDU37380.1 response regulator receiver domain protein [Clostridium sporogenes ATCC 15579]EKS4393680.1 response regulator transcription factor [Clostridium botulinum]KIS23409.1 transcriptional regulator [Clostridium botulinum B2 450]
MGYKIMIIEDDKNIAKLLGEHIEKYGYEALVAKDFEKILEIFEMEKPNLILLDVNLPKFDGYYWCRRIREKSLCPIIFISARDSEMNQVMAIESGADDYITKPFYYEVVLAKIKSQLRRVYGDYAANSQVERILDVEGLLFYPERLQVHFNGKEAMLSKKEGDLLDAMMKIYPKVATREELLEKIWDDTTFVDENTLNVNIARLRKKLSDLGIKDSIETVRGAGYRLNVTWRK